MLDPANAKKFARELALCTGKRPGEELYHLASDPDQVDNLVLKGTHREALDRMRGLLETDLQATNDPRIEGRDPWQKYPTGRLPASARPTTRRSAKSSGAPPAKERRTSRSS